MPEKDQLLIGVDIGAKSIKVCELITTQDGFELVTLVAHDLDELLTEDGFIIDFGEIVQAISYIRDNILISHTNIAIALKGSSTLVRRVYVYTEKVEELDEIFRWIADQYIPIDPEEYSLSYTVISSVDRYNHASILVAGAKKDTITDFISILESSKVTPKVIEPEALSIMRLYRALNLPKKSISAIIHIGHIGSLIIFIKDANFDFSKEISIGGMFFSSKLSSSFNLPAQEIEHIKTNPINSKQASEIIECLEEILKKDFGSKLEEAIKLYQLRGGGDIENIYLSGGGATIFGLKEAIMTQFSIPVEFLDPWMIIDVPEKFELLVDSDMKYSYNVAIGLSMHRWVY